MACPQQTTPNHGLEESSLKAALADAAARCAAAGERLTTARGRVLEMLLGSAGPRKAYDLIANFGAPREQAKPATIYRALEFLVGLGLVHRIETTSSYVACSGSGGSHSPGFLICECCGTVAEFEVDVMPIQAIADASSHNVGRVVLEVLGVCRACRPKEGSVVR